MARRWQVWCGVVRQGLVRSGLAVSGKVRYRGGLGPLFRWYAQLTAGLNACTVHCFSTFVNSTCKPSRKFQRFFGPKLHASDITVR